MKIRINPLFPAALRELTIALGQYWRELANYLNNFSSYPHQWRKQQYGAYKTLTSASNTIAIDLGESNNFAHTLTEDTTLAAPTNAKAGQAGVIQITQDSTARTLAFNAFWKWPGGTDGTVSTGSGDVDVISYVVSANAAYATCVMLNDIS